jgi:hypothetical protein
MVKQIARAGPALCERVTDADYAPHAVRVFLRGTSVARSRGSKEGPMDDHWRFEQDENRRWRWQRIDGATERTQSNDAFDRATDCMLDAVRYVVTQRRASAESSR